MTCPACEHADTPTFLALPGVPVFCNVLHASRDAALHAARGTLDLAFCTACGLIFNRAFDPALVRYEGVYENALHFSPHFREYNDALAKELAQGMAGKTIVEAGCGDGTFLASVCRNAPGSRGIGFDPAFDPARPGLVQAPGITIRREYYTSASTDARADLVLCRHVLEHIQRPMPFLRDIRAALGPRDARVFFEVPDTQWILDQHGIWDLIYEHCSYFTPVSLRLAFERAGFGVDGTATVYGGQFLTLRARPAPAAPQPRHETGRELATLAQSVRGFAGVHAERVAHWRQALRDLHAAGRRAVLWGAGSKGVTFLNTFARGESEAVHAVVDVNPRKQGCFVAGTGHEIVAPERIKALSPDAAIIMNPVYRDEIKRQLAAMGVHAEILVA